MTKYNSSKKAVLYKSVTVLLISTLYAIIRYNYFGNVPVSDISIFVFNKAIALSIVFILGIMLYDKINITEDNHKNYLDVIKVFAVAHIIMSLTIHGNTYFPKLYKDGLLTFNAGMATLSGVILVVMLFFKIIKPKSIIIYSLIGSHVLFYGFKGWFTPEKWHGHLPPITLVSFVVVLFLAVYKYKIKNRT